MPTGIVAVFSDSIVALLLHRPVAMAKRFQDLIAWQLSVELCEVVFEITENGKAASDGEFQSQIRRAAKAAPSLIAEGFVRYTTPEMVRYLRMARGELGEVQSNLEVARRTKYFSAVELGRAETLARRAMGTTTNFLKSKLRQLRAEAESRKKKQR